MNCTPDSFISLRWANTLSFTVRAPRLPPTMSIVFFSGSSPNCFTASSWLISAFTIFCLTGFPVIIILSAGKKRSIPS